MPEHIWKGLHVKHLRGSLKMREVQACEIMLRALRHCGIVGGEAHVDEDVWERIPEDYDLNWELDPDDPRWHIEEYD